MSFFTGNILDGKILGDDTPRRKKRITRVKPGKSLVNAGKTPAVRKKAAKSTTKVSSFGSKKRAKFN